MEKLVNPVKENNFNQSNDNVVSERSNININKTYMTSQNFLIGAAMFLIRSIDEQRASILEAKNDLIEFRTEIKKDVTEDINQQNALIADFIRINTKGR